MLLCGRAVWEKRPFGSRGLSKPSGERSAPRSIPSVSSPLNSLGDGALHEVLRGGILRLDGGLGASAEGRVLLEDLARDGCEALVVNVLGLDTLLAQRLLRQHLGEGDGLSLDWIGRLEPTHANPKVVADDVLVELLLENLGIGVALLDRLLDDLAEVVREILAVGLVQHVCVVLAQTVAIVEGKREFQRHSLDSELTDRGVLLDFHDIGSFLRVGYGALRAAGTVEIIARRKWNCKPSVWQGLWGTTPKQGGVSSCFLL